MSGRAVSFTEEKPHVFEYEQTEVPQEEKNDKQSQERKDWFMDFMSVSMGIRTPVKLLDEVSFEGVAKFIADSKCRNVITMAGAGISTSAGIPDYRSPGTGLFDLLKDKYPNVQSVQDLFNINFFLKDPAPFFERSKRFFEHTLKPTPCHYFVRLLYEKGLLLRHYTQNIDTLERLAGLPADKVVEAHGTYYTAHCMDCDREYDFAWMEERVMRDDIPRCEEEDCTGVVKPDIVMFGESLSTRFSSASEEDTLKCDLLIVMGTALAVQPFATLTSKVKTSTPRLYINLDRGSTSSKHPMSALMFGASFDFDAEDNYRDVFKQEKCDTAVYEMADILGWKEELRTLVEKEHKRFDKEAAAKGKTNPPPISKSTELPATKAFESDDKTRKRGDTDTSPSSKAQAKTTLVTSSKTNNNGNKTSDKKDTKVAGSEKSGTVNVGGKSYSGGKDGARKSVTKNSAAVNGKGRLSSSSAKK